jgi:hypothetical protein
VAVNAATSRLARQLQRVLKRWGPQPPAAFTYVAPELRRPVPDSEHAVAVSEARPALPHQHRHRIKDYDFFHERHFKWRQTIDEARQAVDLAQPELDAGEVSPFKKPSYQIRQGLGVLGGTVANPDIVGDDPLANTMETLKRLEEAYCELKVWENKLRALAHQKRPSVNQRLEGNQSSAVETPIGTASAPKDANPPAPSPFAFRDEHLTILMELVGSGTLVKASELDGRSGMPPYDRIVTLLAELENGSPPYVRRPRGQKSGYAATDHARQELTRRGLIDPPSS